MIFRATKNRSKQSSLRYGDPCGNRTRVTAVKGRCLNRLTNGPYDDNPTQLGYQICSGSFLLSRAVSRQVSSTLRSLTSVFGMGTGGTSLLSSPEAFSQKTRSGMKILANSIAFEGFDTLKKLLQMRPFALRNFRTPDRRSAVFDILL